MSNTALYQTCTLCPRACGADRTQGQRGVCGASDVLRLGRADLHWWEEPCLVGNQGSGAVFFAYCSLQCVYCQNQSLVQGAGVEVTPQRFADILLRLQNVQHAANINLVTPTHYVPTIASVVRSLRSTGALHIPVVYNTSSYETVSTVRLMDGLVDIYLADFKYQDSEVARAFSRARDYPVQALQAIDEMVRQVPSWLEDDQGLLKKGVIVRHLVLPGQIEGSLKALKMLFERYGNRVRLSIMSQFTPLMGESSSGNTGTLSRYGLNRVVSTDEYEYVLDYADYLGFEDYFWQEGASAEESFIPVFDGTGC